MESALRGTQRSTPYWSLLVLLKVLLVSPHICSQIHILFSFYANIVYWVFSAVSSVDDCLKTLLSTRMLFAECFSGIFLFPLPQSAAVKSSFSQRLRMTHRGEDLTFGKPRWCLDGSPWYVWHQRSTVLPCTWTLSVLWLLSLTTNLLCVFWTRQQNSFSVSLCFLSMNIINSMSIKKVQSLVWAFWCCTLSRFSTHNHKKSDTGGVFSFHLKQSLIISAGVIQRATYSCTFESKAGKMAHELKKRWK